MNKLFLIQFWQDGKFKGFYSESEAFTKFYTTENNKKMAYPLIKTTQPSRYEPTPYEFNAENWQWIQEVVDNLHSLMQDGAMETYDIRIVPYQALTFFTGEEDFFNVKSEIADSFN